MSVVVEASAEGAVFWVKARAGGRSNSICGEHDGQLKVSVTQAPERGKANQAIIELLADELGVRRGQISLITGETNARKKFLIREMSVDELSRKLNELAAAGS